MSQQTIYTSAARTATPTAVILNTRFQSKMRVVLDVTAVTSTPSLVVTVEVLDVASGKYVAVATSSAIATVSTTALTVADGLTGQVRITVAHGNSNSATYTLGAHQSR